MPYLELGYEQYGSETRRLTVMFASLGVDLSSAQTAEGMKKIQKIVTTVQQQVYRLEGSLNKLVMDDKGSTLICIWGLCPFSHEDDAARAILTGINIRKELAKIENTWCNVGISTGEVFSGVVGTSGSRKEFSVLGDYVNLAARIMYWPKKYKLTGKINVDMQTKKEADNFIKFNFKGHCEFKGKSVSLPIFEPVDPEEEVLQCQKKVVPFDTFLKIHSNPFLVDRNSEHKKKHCRQIGRENILHRVCDDLFDFFDQDKEDVRPYILAVLGEIGSGKTLFARCIYDNLKKRKDFLRDDNLGQDFKPILTSALNAESQMKFLNAWRPILQMMMTLHCKKNKMDEDKIIKRLLNSNTDDIYDIILDIFNMPDLKKQGKLKLPMAEDPIWFVKREKYSEDIVDGILDFMIEFIKEVLGQKDDYYSEMDQSQMQSDDDRSHVSQHRNHANVAENPMLLIFDTVFLMDEASWKLLELIKDECSQIAIILLMQTDTNNQPKIHPEAKVFYQETFGNHIELLKIIDLPPFKVEELNQMVTEIASKYQASMTEEIQLQTMIEDPATSIKNADICKQKEKELKKKHLIHENFQQISDEILQITLQRCEGNPMICLNFLYNLLTVFYLFLIFQNDFLVIKDSCLQPTQLFKKCKARSDWTLVPVPGINQKINCSIIDSFIKELRSKMNKIDAENAVQIILFKSYSKGVLILKSAAVIGEVFGSRVLQHIIPLRNESQKSLLNVLKILEQKDFIEILDETDQKNVICRFRKCFLRETIYQIMLYRAQKKGLHQLMVQFIQNNPNSFDNDPEQEADKLLNHILIAEDLDSEDKVPFKSKQGLIVKKIANKLMKNPNCIVKSGYLTKQGDKPNKKVEKRLMIIKPKEISWYHNDKELQAGKALGVIYMSSIYHCMPANTAKSTDDLNVNFSYNSLQIGTCAWKKKTQDKEGKREFIFGAKDEAERDEFIACIEYLRAKAIYDNFTQKFCNITFPLRRQSEDIEVEMRDFLANLNDFGLKFKTQARLAKGSILQIEDTTAMQRSNSRGSNRQSRMTSKIGSFATYNLQQVNETTYVSAMNNPKDIAAKLKKLYNVSIVSFINMVGHNSNKQPNIRQDNLKKVPEILKNSTLLMINDESGIDINNHHQSQIIKHPLNQTIVQQQQQQQIIDDNTPNERLSRYKQLRRISAIARREITDDNQDVKNYLEEMKSLDKKSQQQKNSDTIKITEENEDDISEASYKNSSLPRKSAISDNTALGSPPPGHFYTTNSGGTRSQNNLESEKAVVESPILQDQVQAKKSRISKQLDMIQGLQKHREMTFHKNAEDEQQQQPADTQQIFALNLKQTQIGKTPKKSSSQLEQIQEQHNTRKKSIHKKKQSAYREHSSSSSDEKSDHSQSADDDEGDKTRSKGLGRLDTGNFSNIEKHEFNSKLLSNNQSLHQSSKASIQQHLAAFPKHESLKKQESPTAQHLQSTPVLETKQNVDQSPQQVHMPNISELITQTIQDQVTKSFQQLFQSVQKMTQQQQSQQQIAYLNTLSPPISQSKRESHSKSFSSSIYDEDWRSQIQARNQHSGGAASSKKISMHQAQAKISQTAKKPSIREQKEETEVDDDDDYVKDPEVDQELKRIEAQQNLRLQPQVAEQQRRASLTKLQRGHTVDPYGQAQGAAKLRGGPFNDQVHRISSAQYPSQFPQNFDMGGQYSNSRFSQSPIYGSDLSPGNSYPYQQPPPQYAYHQEYQHPQHYPGYEHHLKQQQHPYTYRSHIDNELFFIEDNFENTPTAFSAQNQYISDISSIIGGDTVETNNQQAIVLEDCQCQLKGEMMQLYEGDKVDVLKIINDVGMAEVRLQSQIGIFPLSCIKLIKRPSAGPNIKQTSPNKTRNNPQLQNSRTVQHKKSDDGSTSSHAMFNTTTTVGQAVSGKQNFFKKEYPIENQQVSSSANSANMLKLQARKKLRQQQNLD